MAFSPNSPQSREMTELRNHLKWLDEERRKTARKMGEIEQRIAQQGREITEREKRIHELEWQLAQVSERIEQMPEMGTGASGQEQRLQDLEWHMSNINAQLVRLPKLDEELVNFREEISQYTVDIEHRLVSQQTEASQRLENDVYSRLREDITQSVAGYDQRLAAVQVDVNDRVDQQIAMSVHGVQEDLLERIARLEGAGLGDIERVTELESTGMANAARLAELESTGAVYAATLAELQSTGMASAARLGQLQSIGESNAARLAELENVGESYASRFTELESVGESYASRLTELDGVNEAIVARLAELDHASVTNLQAINRLEAALNDLKLDDGSLAAIAVVEQELELRQAEEIRLANLIGIQESKFDYAKDQIEEMNRVVAEMQKHFAASQAELQELRGWYKDLNDNWKPALMEASGKIMPLSERLTVLSNAVTKSEANLQTLSADQSEMREQLVGVSDEVRSTRQDISHQVDSWQGTIDEHKETIERFTQQWLTLSNQYKEARMAVQNFAHWQKQLEQQKREASEMLRVESNRMQSRWEGFLLEIQEQLKNVDLDLAQKWQSFEIENEQRWAASRRNEQLWREELAGVDDLIVKLQQDSRNLIWRVQAAQADAIKQWPRLLLEEVEKAVELNPNRRLQPTPGASSRSDMSVADAIEQGLIKVDYDDDLSGDMP